MSFLSEITLGSYVRTPSRPAEWLLSEAGAKGGGSHLRREQVSAENEDCWVLPSLDFLEQRL